MHRRKQHKTNKCDRTEKKYKKANEKKKLNMKKLHGGNKYTLFTGTCIYKRTEVSIGKQI